MLWHVMRWLNVVNKKVFYGICKVDSPFDNPTYRIPDCLDLRADIAIVGIRNIVPVSLGLYDTDTQAIDQVDQLVALQKRMAPDLLYNKSHDTGGTMKKGLSYTDPKTNETVSLKKKRWITNGRQDVSVGPGWLMDRTRDPEVTPEGWWFGKTWNFKRRTIWNQEQEPPVPLRVVDVLKEPEYSNNGVYDQDMEWTPIPVARKMGANEKLSMMDNEQQG